LSDTVIGEIVAELLGTALSPGGRFGEGLAALISLASGLFSFGFGVWFAFIAADDAPFAVKLGIVAFFALMAFACFYLFWRFLSSNRAAK
jgi:hypothetical protein